jgi:hypothetical protein
MMDSSTQVEDPLEAGSVIQQKESLQKQAYKHVVMMAESILFLFMNVPFPLTQDGVRYAKELIAILNDLDINTEHHQAMLDRNASQFRPHLNQMPWPYSGPPPQFLHQPWTTSHNFAQ